MIDIRLLPYVCPKQSQIPQPHRGKKITAGMERPPAASPRGFDSAEADEIIRSSRQALHDVGGDSGTPRSGHGQHGQPFTASELTKQFPPRPISASQLGGGGGGGGSGGGGGGNVPSAGSGSDLAGGLGGIAALFPSFR